IRAPNYAECLALNLRAARHRRKSGYAYRKALGLRHLNGQHEHIVTELAANAAWRRHYAEQREREERCQRHVWVFTGSAYGGDDERWMGEGRCYCEHCGADGDA